LAEGDELEMRVTGVDAGNRRIVLEVTRVPRFEGGEPIFRNSGEALEPEAPAAAPEADATSAEEAPAAEASPEEAPAAAEEAPAAEASPEE
jgi:hypothetical protein